VNLVYYSWIDRFHARDRNRIAIAVNCDPIYGRGRRTLFSNARFPNAAKAPPDHRRKGDDERFCPAGCRRRRPWTQMRPSCLTNLSDMHQPAANGLA
jgi:hypothetical protein